MSVLDSYDEGLNKNTNIESAPSELSAADRVLLFNDGSQTTILEALCGGPIAVKKIHEAFTTTQAHRPYLTGDRFYVREVMLHDARADRPVVHAGSIFDLSVADEAVIEELKQTTISLGRILHRRLGALRRDVVGFAFDNAAPENAYFGESRPAKVLRRVYRVWSGDRAMALIIERFPTPFMEWLAR